MTAETNEYNGVSEGSKVEFVEKSGLNSSGDPENAVNCNGISCDKLVANEVHVSEDADGSYVFVKRSDTVTNGPLDTGAAEIESVEEENGVLESNVGPSSEEKQVESEAMRSEKEENGESCLENECTVEEAADDRIHVEEAADDDRSHVEEAAEDRSHVEEAADDGSHVKLESAVTVEDNLESQITDTEAVELESAPINEKDAEALNVADQVKETTGDLRMEPEVRVADTEIETEGGSGSVKSVASSPVYAIDTETEVQNGCVESGETAPSCAVGLQLENEVVNGSIRNSRKLSVSPVHEVDSEAEVRNGSAESGESMPTCLVNGVGSESEVRDESVESGKRLHDCLVDDPELEPKALELEIGNGSIKNDEIIVAVGPVDDIKLGQEVGNDSVESSEDIPISNVDGAKLESEVEVRSGPVENGSVNSEVDVENDDLSVNRDGGNKPICDEVGGLQVEILPSSSQEDPSGANVSEGKKLDVEVVDVENEDQNVDRSGDNTRISESIGEIGGIHSNGIQPSSHEDSSCADDSAEQKGDTDVIATENEDLSVSRDDENKSTCSEVEGVEGTTANEVLPASQEDSSSADALDEQKVDTDVGKRIHNFIIRIPRYVDDKIRAQIGIAQFQVDEKTQNRDSIRGEMQRKKATCSEYREKFEAARLEERAARDAVNAKRQEIDSIQIMINRMKNATSVDEIDDRIQNMEHMIQHETMPLKDEKQLIREIKQLKNAREQLLANMSSQAELQEAFDQRDTIEDRFRLLKQELETLKKEVSRTEGITKAAKKKYQDECESLNDLQAQFRAADDLRQETYSHFQDLKKQLYEKNKYFRMYKDDQKAAADYASAGNRKTLECHCNDQVEKFMELWNTNDEFRSEYVKHNVMSTLRRLKTLDGRSLGPHEEPPVLRNFVVEERMNNAGLPLAKINTGLPVSSIAETSLEKPGTRLAPEKVDLKPAVMVEQKNLVAKSKKPTKLSSVETNSVAVSTREEVDEEAEKENKRTKAEEELAMKEEVLRKEEAAAKLKEQRRLEEKAKAKEAEERKRRNAEKAQARAALRAQKEAELKEKEREKRAKKKEKKKVGASEATNDGIQGELAPGADENTSETVREPEIKEKMTTVTKRSMKPIVSAKLTKSKPLPLPLRHRGKRKMQTWMWAVLAAFVILALFLAGNYAFTFEFGLPKFSF